MYDRCSPRLDPDALDLLEKLLQLQSKNRIPAAEAMRHQYFQSIGPRVHLLPNSEQPQNQREGGREGSRVDIFLYV